jgi:hypothetical protein
VSDPSGLAPWVMHTASRFVAHMTQDRSLPWPWCNASPFDGPLLGLWNMILTGPAEPNEPRSRGALRRLLPYLRTSANHRSFAFHQKRHDGEGLLSMGLPGYYRVLLPRGLFAATYREPRGCNRLGTERKLRRERRLGQCPGGVFV